MNNLVFITLGSNIEPEENLCEAVRLLGERFTILATSHVYETAPIDAAGQVSSEQANFLNAAVLIETDLPPYSLKYEVLREIETQLGRVRTEDKYASRTIDLDIALYGYEIITNPGNGLVIPDPDSLTRAHVALPLADLAPDFVHPITRETLAEVAERVALRRDITYREMALDC